MCVCVALGIDGDINVDVDTDAGADDCYEPRNKETTDNGQWLMNVVVLDLLL